jgi:hypothetical protein
VLDPASRYTPLLTKPSPLVMLEGLRLLVTSFRSNSSMPCHRRPALGTQELGSVMLRLPCERSHQSGHALAGDFRPQEFRRRINRPSLCGVNIQRLFGSRRTLKTVEDFTELSSAPRIATGTP